MANISVTGVVLTVTVLFFTVPLCYGRLTIPENVINIETDFPISLFDSEVNPIFRLPIEEKSSEFQLAEILPEIETGAYVITDMLTANETGNNEVKKRPESVPSTEEAGVTEVVDKLPVITKAASSEVSETVTVPSTPLRVGVTEVEVSETVTVPSTPLRLARFRPVNRPCHHRHHRHHHLFPHGGNMILPTGENGDFDRVIVHDQLHRMVPRWSSIPYLHHHHHHHNNDDSTTEESNSMFRHHHHDDDSNNKESNSVFKHRHHHHDEDSDNQESNSIFRHHHHHHDDSNNQESNSVFRRSARFNKEKFNKHFHHHDHEDRDNGVKSFNNRKVKNQNQNQNENQKLDTKVNGLFNRIRKMMINF